MTTTQFIEEKKPEADVLPVENAAKASGENEIEIKWLNVIIISIYHVLAVYSIIMYWNYIKILTYIWGIMMATAGGFGVTGGAHRLWAHRAYKAKLPLKIILLICFSIAGQNSVHDWVRDHRVHHKFSETDADPHNAKRGFFFSHVGWLMCKKHKEVIKQGNKIDMSDILEDPLLQIYDKYFIFFKILLCFILPSIVPPLLWDEEWVISLLSTACVRYVVGLNFTWLVNSAAHIWGNKPYDKRISPAENKTVAILALGEGWHNYHHVFPWDYKASELGASRLNLTARLIDMFASIGWAYDLKTPSKEVIEKTAIKYGDGTFSQTELLAEKLE